MFHKKCEVDRYPDLERIYLVRVSFGRKSNLSPGGAFS